MWVLCWRWNNLACGRIACCKHCVTIRNLGKFRRFKQIKAQLDSNEIKIVCLFCDWQDCNSNHVNCKIAMERVEELSNKEILIFRTRSLSSRNQPVWICSQNEWTTNAVGIDCTFASFMMSILPTKFGRIMINLMGQPVGQVFLQHHSITMGVVLLTKWQQPRTITNKSIHSSFSIWQSSWTISNSSARPNPSRKLW